MSLRDTLRKAAGLLVELPEEEARPPAPPPSEADLDKRLASVDQAMKNLQAGGKPARTVEQIVRESEGPNLDQIKVAAADAAPEPAADGRPDYSPIYKRANLPPSPFTAEQMLDMLASLPADLPLETKRQTVKVTLGSVGKTIGATPETIVADASRKLAALTAYVEALSQQTAKSVSQGNLEIAALQSQIEGKRKAIQAAQQRLERLSEACKSESERLDDVLEFFSLDVPPSKYAPGAPSEAPKPA